jgi:tetratricopeptide (TPR) repeat protein
MKAEHRKELATNTLADKLGNFIQSFKEGPSRNATIYGTIVVVALVLVVVYRWVSANATSNDSARWASWDQLSNRDELEKFAADNVDTEQGRLARFELARLDLQDGLRELGSSSPGDSVKHLRKAAETYEKLAGESGNTPLLSQEALQNAAKARESLGEYDQARELYGRLARDFPQSIRGKDASEQAKALEQPGQALEQLKQLVKEPAAPTGLPQKP